jgi:hypothetical protein
MNFIPDDTLKPLGNGLTSLRAVNRLPVAIKERLYAALIPPDLLSAYRVDPLSLLDGESHPAFQFDFPPDRGLVKIQLKRSISDLDPLVFIQLSDTSYNQVEFDWILINDPDSERFQIHLTDSTQFLPPGSESRNVVEEIRAMNAGLAPGQVRRGLRRFPEIMELVESFLSRLKIHLVYGYPYAYHNAIELERIGYFYGTGKELMVEIDKEFQPGGIFFRRLDGSTPFRQPGMEKTVRGRSWAIHDGIMDKPWICPMMIKMIGRKQKDYTFPDKIYLNPRP